VPDEVLGEVATKRRNLGFALVVIGIVLSFYFIPMGALLMHSQFEDGTSAFPLGLLSIAMSLAPILAGIVLVKKNPKQLKIILPPHLV
jgi:putative Mn2+ efflux pump MntP